MRVHWKPSGWAAADSERLLLIFFSEAFSVVVGSSLFRTLQKY
jgi:hypothetical protein